MRADMLRALLVCLYFAFCATIVAQPPPSIVCVAGQCLQGSSNTTIGATLSAAENITIQLLPGQYTTSTDPQLLHDLLTSRSSTLVGSVGFQSASLALPLNLQLEPGIAIYPNFLYSGQASFTKVPEAPVGNTSTPLSANSLAIPPNVWATVSYNNRRVILWDSVPDTSQLPSTGSLSLLDVQSSGCSPPCSGPGVCSASGTCTCPTGFTGSSCESCAEGFFGPTCEQCPGDCPNCDQGTSGTGRCLTPTNSTSHCNCLNGQCEADGTCTCNNGWTTADNGTACARCIPGFYLSARGCEACGVGCSQCEDESGLCETCRTGFTIDTNNRTKCAIPTGANCSDGFFVDGGQCSRCSPACRLCTGPTPNECSLCAPLTYFLNGTCVATDIDGVCQGSNGMVGNPDKGICDSCDAKCISCNIPNFSTGSRQQQCTRCLPGSFLFQGKCVDSCSAGMFASQNGTCTNCSSSCSTCAGSPDFCLTCPSGQVASSGRCISACPSDTFISSGTCTKCHPDCSTCSGPSFNQCNSCPTSRPVLTGGRCLFTCTKTEYFNTSTSTCQACDSSCSSCSGPDPQNCLACSSSVRVLRGGSCVSANCPGDVIPGLGVCLSELVQVPSSSPSGSGSGSPSPLPTITGLTDPTSVTSGTSTSPMMKLVWWKILLVTLGCVFIFFVFIWCWRRRAKRGRENRTRSFWLVRLGRRLFGHKRDDWVEPDLGYLRNSFDSPKIPPIEHDILSSKLAPPRPAVKERTTTRDSVDDLISSYEHSPKPADGRRKKDNPRRLKGRIDRNSHSLYGSKHSRRETLQDDSPPPTKLQFNSEGVIVNRFNQGNKKVVRPTIDGDTGASSVGHPIPIYAAPPYTPRPIGPASSGTVAHHPGGNRMPVTLPGHRQGPSYTIPPGVQTVPQFHLPQPQRHSNALPHNPFRH